MQEISIYLKPLSWNVLARKNHWIYTKIFNEWKQATWIAATEAKIKPHHDPVKLHVLASWKGKRRHDIDNIILKPVIDQLVSMGVFLDDRIGCIDEITIRGVVNAKEDCLKIGF